MIAAATARSGLVLYADGWGDLADGDDQELAVRAIAEAIEAPSATRSTRALTLGLSVVLGESGRRAHLKDASLIARSGRATAPGRDGQSAGCAGDHVASGGGGAAQCDASLRPTTSRRDARTRCEKRGSSGVAKVPLRLLNEPASSLEARIWASRPIQPRKHRFRCFCRWRAGSPEVRRRRAFSP